MTSNNADPEDTGQISVAELLARNGQKSNLNSGGRRRRGVKGGISVAELTGEIPVVRDEPASAEAPVVAPPRAAAPAPSPQPSSKPQFQQSTRRQQEPELLSGSTTAAADLLNQAHDENERRPYGSAGTQRPVPVRSRQDTASRQETVGKPSEEVKPAERSSRSSGFVQRSRFSRTEADAVPKTDVVDKPSQDRPRAADQPSTAAMPAQSRPQPSDTVRSRSPLNPAAAAEKKAPEAEKKTAATPAAAPTPDAKPKFGRAFERRAASKPDDAVTEVTDAVKVEPVDKKVEPVGKKVEPVGKKDEKDQVVAEDDLATEAADDSKERSDKKNAAKQWLALAGQGAVAIVVGALLFKGFEKLWDMLPWVALALAVLVIVGLVAVVRILRRTDDLLSMVIAIAVGVFVTLGPLAFQLSTG